MVVVRSTSRPMDNGAGPSRLAISTFFRQSLDRTAVGSPLESEAFGLQASFHSGSSGRNTRHSETGRDSAQTPRKSRWGKRQSAVYPTVSQVLEGRFWQSGGEENNLLGSQVRRLDVRELLKRVLAAPSGQPVNLR